jgi:hypothetical protein
MRNFDYEIFVAYRNSEIFAYSYNLNEFFGFLRSFYKYHGNLELEICKLKNPKEIIEFEGKFYGEFEIVEFSQNIYLRNFEYKVWDSYFRELYAKVREVYKNPNKKYLDYYEGFLNYLGEEKIESIIRKTGSVEEEYKLKRDYLRKIEDN